jgi:hypothetical protein
MPRCPNGTRKNKFSGICENPSKKKKVELKLELCLVDLKKFENYKNLSEQKKYFKLIDTIRQLENELENLDTDKKLSEEEVENIITPYKIGEKEKEEIKQKLMMLTYDNKYISCFTGKKSANLHDMAMDKLSCFLKYGDEI